MNQGDLHAGHDLLRQTLIDYADKKAPLTRSEIVRQQQRSGSSEISAIMVSPAAATAAPEQKIDEATMDWALRELADGWIQNNEREGQHGFYQNARRVLNAFIEEAR